MSKGTTLSLPSDPLSGFLAAGSDIETWLQISTGAKCRFHRKSLCDFSFGFASGFVNERWIELDLSRPHSFILFKRCRVSMNQNQNQNQKNKNPMLRSRSREGRGRQSRVLTFRLSHLILPGLQGPALS